MSKRKRAAAKPNARPAPNADPKADTIGRRIRERRLALGLTLDDLGERLGVTRAAVYCWEAGTRGFDVPTGPWTGSERLLLIAAALGCEVLDLIPRGLGQPARKKSPRLTGKPPA